MDHVGGWYKSALVKPVEYADLNKFWRMFHNISKL